MWGAVLAWVLGVLAALALLLLVPLHVKLRARYGEGLYGEVELRWLVLRKRIPLRRGERARRGGGGFRPSLERGLLAPLRRLASRLRRAIRVVELDARVRLGAGDPADTAVLVGWAAPLVVLLGALPAARIRVEPDWDEATLQGDVRASVRVVPLVLLAVALAFVAARPVRRTLRASRRGAAA